MRNLPILLAFLSVTAFSDEQEPSTKQSSASPFTRALIGTTDSAIELDYLYSNWQPSKIPNTDIETTGFNISRLTINPNGRFPYLGTLQYWWTPGNRAEQKELIEAQKEETAFEKLVAEVRIPVDDWTYYYNRELTAFLGNVKTKSEAVYVRNNGTSETLPEGADIGFLTKFDKHELGINMYSLVDVYWEQTEYERPYILTNDGSAVSNEIYDSTITGSGLGVRGHIPIIFTDTFDWKIGGSLIILSGDGDVEYNGQSFDETLGENRVIQTDKFTFQTLMTYYPIEWLNFTAGYRFEQLQLFSKIKDTESNSDAEERIEHIDEIFHFVHLGTSLIF